jgi:hypothetical protein
MGAFEIKLSVGNIYSATQLQHSSINLPSFSIECTYFLASPAENPPCVSAANAIASFTAAGILFEDL